MGRTDDGQQADLGQYELPEVDESSGILIVSAMHTTLIDDGTTMRSLSIQVFPTIPPGLVGARGSPGTQFLSPLVCSTPLATSFMPIHGIVYCLSYYPSCTKVQD